MGQARLLQALEDGDDQAKKAAISTLARGLALSPMNSLYHQVIGVGKLEC